MAKNVVDVKVQFSTTGEAALDRAKANINSLDDGVKKAGVSWGKFTLAMGAVAAGAGTVYVALREVYGTLKEGAALQTTINRFDKLAESIDSTSDALLGRMRDATRGQISDMDLMASASQIMSLGLARNADQVVRLATVAGTLNWDMQQVILTFANMSTMRLDALGLSVEEVTSKAKELEAAGMSAQDAFKEAVIQAGESRLDIGGVSEVEASFKRLEAAVANAGDTLKAAFTEGAVEALGDTADAVNTLSSAVSDLAPLVSSVSTSLFEPLVEGALKLQVVMRQLDYLEMNGIKSIFDPAMVTSTTLMSGGIDGLRVALTILDRAMEESIIESYNAIGAHYSYATATGMAADAASGMVGPINASATAMENTAAAADVATGAMARLAMAQMIVATYQPGADFADKVLMTSLTNSRTEMSVLEGMIERQRRSARDATDALALGFDKVTRRVGGYTSAVNEADEATRRLNDAFKAEISLDPSDGFIDAEGLVNIERANELLYSQAAAAGASATELAMLGIATGQFSEEQAKAALKAAVLQEAIARMAKSIVSGQTSIDDAVAAVGDIKVSLDSTTDMASIQAMIAGIESDPTSVNVDFIPLSATVRTEMDNIDGTQLTVHVNYESSGMPGYDWDGDGVPNSADNYPYDALKRQLGGPVGRNRPYLVGEAGPELFVPGINGFVVNNNKLNSGPGNMNVTINISGAAAQSGRIGAEVRNAMDQFYADLRYEGVSW